VTGDQGSADGRRLASKKATIGLDFSFASSRNARDMPFVALGMRSIPDFVAIVASRVRWPEGSFSLSRNRGELMRALWLPLLAAALAIAITSLMDMNGLFVYSALALCPLLLVFWLIKRLPRKAVGFALAPSRYFVYALLFPIVVQGAIAAAAAYNHQFDFSHTTWWKVGVNLALLSVTSLVIAIVTEEGFFRGWLWAAFRDARLGSSATLLWTSVLFAAWHWSAITLDTGFNVEPARIPLFLLNAAVLGAIWGVMRDRSGSIVVSSLSHAVWNAGAYVLYGYGTHAGALGIADTYFYGPEVGIMGLGLNAAYLLAALLFWKRAPSAPTA
jgi:uncharacterized protein